MILFILIVQNKTSDSLILKFLTIINLGLKGDLGVFKQRRGEAHADGTLL